MISDYMPNGHIEVSKVFKQKTIEDFKVGEWYFNPEMAKYGGNDFLYTKLFSIEERYTISTKYIEGEKYLSMKFDEGFLPDGTYRKLKPEEYVPQSNPNYDAKMKLVTIHQINTFFRSKKYGL